MNADLEKTLSELGPEGRETVGRLLQSRRIEASRPLCAPRTGWRPLPIAATALVAASLAMVLLSVQTMRFMRNSSAKASPALCSRSPQEVYSLAYKAGPAELSEILRTQRPDGSWANDFLTRQNAAALRNVASARVAYLRAERYLRSHGLNSLSAAELQQRREELSQRLRTGGT